MAQISSNKCETCSDNLGSQFCRECQKYMCDQCRIYHDKFIKGHSVSDSHSVSKSVIKSKLFCESHDLGFLHFCDACKCLTCLKCTTSDHKGHTFTDIAEKATATREVVIELCNDLKSKSSTLSDMIEQVKKQQLKKIQEDTESFKAAAQETCDNFESVVKQVTEFSMTHANDYLEIEEQGLKFTLARLQKLYDECKTESAKIEQLLQEKHDLTFYIQQKDLIQNVEAMDEIPQINEPREIGNFDKDKLADDVFERIQYKYKLKVMKDKDDQLKQFNAELQNEKQNATKQKKLSDTEMTNLLKEKEVLATELKDERQTLGEMQASHAKVLKEKEDQVKQFQIELQDEREKNSKQKDHSDTEVSNIRQKNEVLVSDLGNERRKLSEMKATHDKFSKEKEEQVKQLQKELRDEREEASKQKYQSNTEVSKIRQENEVIVGDLENERRKLTKMKASYDKIVQDKEDQLEKLERELHDEREIASNQKNVLDNEISKVRQEKEIIATKLRDLEERHKLSEMQASYAK